MKDLKFLCVLALLVTGFVLSCKDESYVEPSGTPPVISDIRLYLYKGTNIDYAEEPEITEWREGDIIMGVLTLNDPDLDMRTVSYSYKCLNNNTTKSGGTQYINQNKNPYWLGFILDDLTPGNWILTVNVKDNGNNSTTFDFDKIIIVNQH